MDPHIRTLALEAAKNCASDIPGGKFGDQASIGELSAGGSQRHFLRLEEDKNSVIILVQPGGGEEFDNYKSIGDFLRTNGIAVPEFYFADGEKGVLVMEDLGDLHLDEALNDVSPDEELAFYRDCMEILFRFQTIVTEQMRSTGFLDHKIFDEGILLGETDYFTAEFANSYAGVQLPAGWDKDRRSIASTLASEQQVFMHRDFQSRNLIVKDGRIRILDFQTAHRGPGLYDAASLLKDPYHPLSQGTRKTLLMEFYYRLTEVGRESGSNFEQFSERFVFAGIQRNLQALAAFAYLGSVKGKRDFLISIEPALDLLEEGLLQARRFQSIQSSVHKIREKLSERK